MFVYLKHVITGENCQESKKELVRLKKSIYKIKPEPPIE
jgi:hypothetical protein